MITGFLVSNLMAAALATVPMDIRKSDLEMPNGQAYSKLALSTTADMPLSLNATKGHITGMAANLAIPSDYKIICDFNFDDSSTAFDGWDVHANPNSIIVLDAPACKGGRAIRFSMNRTDDFSNVVNGSPRAELAKSKDSYLYANKDYIIKFKTYLPSDYQFDTEGNREGIMQIHQTQSVGTSPLYLLGLDGNRYFSFTEPPHQSQKFDFWGDASQDKGKWISWALQYKASTDDGGSLELYKDGVLVSTITGPNSYEGDGAYVKIGVYKWDWNNTEIANRSIYYDDVAIAEKDTPTPPAIPADPSSLSVSGLTQGASSGNYYINLTWSDNSQREDGYKILQSVNSTTDFKEVAVADANSTSYAVNIGSSPADGTYYYQVIGVNSEGESKASNTASKEVSIATPPDETPLPDGYKTTYSTGFEEGSSVFNGWHVHANTGSASAVTAPAGSSGMAMKFSMNRTDNFSNVVNGKPRAELARVPNNYLYAGTDYIVNFKTYLPSNFQFDSNGNREGFMQIHQSQASGTSPLFLLGLDGNRYFSFAEPPYQSQRFDFWGDASQDRGKWINWSLHYNASTGNDGVLALYKNGQLVSAINGPNSYSGDGAYIKIGLYKWAWNNTSVSNRTIYHDNVSISERVSGSTTPIQPSEPAIPADPSGLSSTGLSQGATSGNYYVNLTWSDNSQREDGYKILQSVNSTSDFKEVHTTSANETSYAVNIGSSPTNGTYYYQVIGINSEGESKASNTASQVVKTDYTPAPASNLTVTSLTQGATSGNYYLNLTWSDNSQREEGYKILQSFNSTSDFKEVATTEANATGYAVNIGSNPAKGTYYYQVIGVNSQAQSEPSNTASKAVDISSGGGNSGGGSSQPPAGYSTMYKTGFEEGSSVFNGWHVHANPGSASAVSAPEGGSGMAMKFSMNRTDNFSNVVNGKPRAELARVPNDYLYAGTDYVIDFKTYLPSNFQFDSNGNREGFMQIHQSQAIGTSPLFLLGLDGNRYFNFAEPPYQSQRFDFWGDASQDRGKWINWSLQYKASTGNDGVLALYKNGQLVSTFNGPNSYSGDGAYIKIGLYKWAWTNTSISNRTIYHDDVIIYRK